MHHFLVNRTGPIGHSGGSKRLVRMYFEKAGLAYSLNTKTHILLKLDQFEDNPLRDPHPTPKTDCGFNSFRG